MEADDFARGFWRYGVFPLIIGIFLMMVMWPTPEQVKVTGYPAEVGIGFMLIVAGLIVMTICGIAYRRLSNP